MHVVATSSLSKESGLEKGGRGRIERGGGNYARWGCIQVLSVLIDQRMSDREKTKGSLSACGGNFWLEERPPDVLLDHPARTCGSPYAVGL